jgi:hypothetical protein
MKKRTPSGATRVEVPDKGSFGWLMRIRRGDTFHQQFFSDAAYGGKRAAQREARARYQQLAAELPAPGSSANRLSTRNSSGTVGVRLAHSVDARGAGHAYDSYVAFWREDGRDLTMRFACSKYGERKALALAALARETRVRDRDWLETELERRAGQRSAERRRKKAVAAAKSARAAAD